MNCVRVVEELLVDVRLGGVLVEDNAMCSCRRQVGAVWIFALVNVARHKVSTDVFVVHSCWS